ncbi:MAG: flagellar biosynthesis protein FlhB [Bacillota bacterium]
MLFFFYEAGDKTEEPTPHRLREARRKGQVFKSMELSAAINVVGVMALFILMGSLVFRGFQNIFLTFMGDMLAFPIGAENAQVVYREALRSYFQMVGPVFIAALVLGVASNLSQVGFLATATQMAPQLNRLNPLEGLKRIFSKRALFELVKSLLKIVIVGSVTFFFIRGKLTEMLVLINQSAADCIQVFWRVMTGLGIRVGLVFLVLAFFDYLFQRHEYKTSLKMSRKEIKDEYKQLEGDPLIRSKIREKQRALARQRMLQDVSQADVVITNPTELAVALRYRADQDNAPRVLAKGAAVLAQRIREIARENDIAVVENPPVAQMLWKHSAVGEEIPLDLYQAVAEILAAVYRMQEARNKRQERMRG